MLLVKLSLLIPFASFLVSVLCFFFDGSRKRATTIAVAIVERAITIWEAIQKRSHEPIYKTQTKIEAKRLRATTFAILEKL